MQEYGKYQQENPEIVNLLSELDITPRDEAIRKIGKAASPVAAEAIEFKIIDGKTYIRFPLEKDEKIFGLGLNFKTVEQRGRVMRLHTDHYSGRDDGRTQAPVPFFVSSKGYGALINSARYIDAWLEQVYVKTVRTANCRDRIPTLAGAAVLIRTIWNF